VSVEYIMDLPCGRKSKFVHEGREYLSTFKWTVSLGCEFPGRIRDSKIGGFQPNLISDLPWREVSRRSFCHDPTGCLMCCQGFLSG
jgi:hypothetical protein